MFATLQVAVLAGDYLLARASVLLAKLDNVDVVQIMASALDALVQGEIMQIKSAPNDMLEMSYYLRKSYYKTASLICDACKVRRASFAWTNQFSLAPVLTNSSSFVRPAH